VNFTSRSRHSLEFGFWTDESALVEHAEKFLVTAMRYSEALDPKSDSFEPDLAPVERRRGVPRHPRGDELGRWEPEDLTLVDPKSTMTPSSRR
jgi:hypothetical protein